MKENGMRATDRIVAVALALVVWAFAGYAVVSRTTAARAAATPSAFDANAGVGLSIGRP